MRNNFVNYFEFGPVVHDMLFKDILSRALEALLFSRTEPLVQFW